MPNTTSAAKRARANARKAARNRSGKSRVKTLEGRLLGLVKAGKLDEARGALQNVASAYDKAARSGVIKPQLARRKRSRLQRQLNAAAKKGSTPSEASKPSA